MSFTTSWCRKEAGLNAIAAQVRIRIQRARCRKSKAHCQRTWCRKLGNMKLTRAVYVGKFAIACWVKDNIAAEFVERASCQTLDGRYYHKASLLEEMTRLPNLQQQGLFFSRGHSSDKKTNSKCNCKCESGHTCASCKCDMGHSRFEQKNFKNIEKVVIHFAVSIAKTNCSAQLVSSCTRKRSGQRSRDITIRKSSELP